MSSRGILDRLRRSIARIEGRKSPGFSRAPAVARSARNNGAPPSAQQQHRPGGEVDPPVLSPSGPGPRYLGLDGLTTEQRWDQTRRRLEWLQEYAEAAVAKARARSKESDAATRTAEQTLEEVRSALQRHLDARPEAETLSKEVDHVERGTLGHDGGAGPETRAPNSGGSA